MEFRIGNRIYRGSCAVEIVCALEGDAPDYPFRGQTIRRFLTWSLARLGDRVPPRELDLSDRLGDEELALSYLYLLDEYGAGEVAVGSQGSLP